MFSQRVPILRPAAASVKPLAPLVINPPWATSRFARSPSRLFCRDGDRPNQGFL